jgi:hypothetical protein
MPVYWEVWVGRSQSKHIQDWDWSRAQQSSKPTFIPRVKYQVKVSKLPLYKDIVCLVVLGFELRALCLLGSHSVTGVIFPAQEYCSLKIFVYERLFLIFLLLKHSSNHFYCLQEKTIKPPFFVHIGWMFDSCLLSIFLFKKGEESWECSSVVASLHKAPGSIPRNGKKKS